MIDTSALRSKILVSAMHGQLSERLPSDSLVDALYEDIIETKNELIKCKAIRKDAEFEEIVEPEYELPDEWKWVRFGEIITLQSGQDLKSNEYNASNDGVPYMTGASNFNDDGTLTVNRWTETPKSIAKYDDILISVKGTVGKVAILFEEEVHIARQIMGIRTYKLNVDFAKYFVESEIERIKAASKGLIPGIERNDILNMSFPLPPIEEQQRIADRITEAFHILDTIDNLQSAYASDLEVLKSKIIDAGIRGKLTEQLPEDGNAEDLYAAIQKEKEKLIKEKKIKKSKALPEITEDEIPFEIPDNWKWVRIGDIFTLQAGKNIPAGSIVESPDNDNIYPCYGGNGLRGFVSNYNVSGKHAIIGRQGALCGNINFAENDFYATEHAVIVYQYADVNVDWAGITLKALNLNQYATSVAQPGLAVSRINKVLIPLPPLPEQERIVEKVLAIEAMIN